MKAKIFDIQRGSFVDGPGIRTTIFFQGCNLRCVWCHNPESWEMKDQLMIFANRCVHCGLCATVCPRGAINLMGATDRAKCVHCGACAEVCPHSARSLCGREEDVESLVRIALKDRDFYENSQGGVTISGGECMLQINALSKLLNRLREEGISTAVDTAGNVPWAHFEKILPATNCFLYDIKALSDKLHKRLTGVSNERILENYRRLIAVCPERIIVRIPVIPNTNDLDDEMERIAAFLRRHMPMKVEWLPYHCLGECKSSALGLESFRTDMPEKGRMDALKQLMACRSEAE